MVSVDITLQWQLTGVLDGSPLQDNNKKGRMYMTCTMIELLKGSLVNPVKLYKYSYSSSII